MRAATWASRLATFASRLETSVRLIAGDAGGADGGGAWVRHITSETPSICVKLERSASAASCADVERGPASAVFAMVMMRSGMTCGNDAGVADRATCAAEMPSKEAKVLRKYHSSKLAAWTVPLIVTAE